MTPPRKAPGVLVEAPGRLHFGVLDLRGDLGRWFGGIGAPAPGPTVAVSAHQAPEVLVTGEDAARAEGYARRFLAHHHIEGGVQLHVCRALPAHAGLGSGTQLALATARAIAGVYGLDEDARSLATAVGRGQRSGVGTWTFAHGGLVVEGGRRSGEAVAPLVARVPLPANWRCIVVIPDVRHDISGAAEDRAITNLPPPSRSSVERVAHVVLMAMLPAAADADLEAFGHALSEVQAITGGWFAPAQGGVFGNPVSREMAARLSEAGAVGIGQSSWGPAVYGLVAGADTAVRIATEIRSSLGGRGAVYEGAFRNAGAAVTALVE